MPRRAIVVQGITQGVGFRPFVYHLAIQFQLGGFVQNQVGGVFIEVEGPQARLDEFLNQLSVACPPLARIEEIHWESRRSQGEGDFKILASEEEPRGQIFISPDVAVCDPCLRELFDPDDRRFQYSFLNCTHCGPRLTIVQAAPYDRERTTMVGFAMCPACRAEYDDPDDRRFHAQPIACPDCGPSLELWNSRGESLTARDPLAAAVDSLRQGKIVAVKGLGGYHLACDAKRQTTVTELRRRKQREERPFAVMVADIAAAQSLCEINRAEEKLLLLPSRPIVLLRKRPEQTLAEAVAPRNPFLGVMLPYTPLHHLLARRLPDTPLVMTSGNRSDEPIAYQEKDAAHRLAGIADLFLSNNRPIHIRCDDSVTRVLLGREAPIRRSRGMAPAPLSLPVTCTRPILALGGQQKSTFALGRGNTAILSHHLGDLDHFEAYRAYGEAIRHFENVFDLQPEVLVHDLHPDYASSHYARGRTEQGQALAVQHHHAHLASCMAEHDLKEPVLGVIFDGTGYGVDGTIWGGEFLIGDYHGFRRAAHLRAVPMPGGEKAIREPWRMGLAYLIESEEESNWFERSVSLSNVDPLRRMIARRLHSPLTSSAGRLFDAVAALAGVRHTVSYEGQAAMELEWLASEADDDGSYPFTVEENSGEPPDKLPLRIDTRPLIHALVRDVEKNVPASIIGRRFHSTLVEIIVQTCSLLCEKSGIQKVVCSGGVFMNALLTEATARALETKGFQVFLHARVPANDGGLSLGQLAIAAACLSVSTSRQE